MVSPSSGSNPMIPSAGNGPCKGYVYRHCILTVKEIILIDDAPIVIEGCVTYTLILT